MENTKYGRRREGRWTPIRAKAQDTKDNPNSWETHLVRKRWDIGLLRALSLWIMMMMMMNIYIAFCNFYQLLYLKMQKFLKKLCIIVFAYFHLTELLVVTTCNICLSASL